MTPRIGRPARLFRAATYLGSLVIGILPTGAAVIGYPDRLTIVEWAARHEVELHLAEERYAATGVVSCNWDDPAIGPRTSIASGQVTALPDLLTLSGHMFFDPFTCAPKAPVGACVFETASNGVVQTAAIDEILAVGFQCGAADHELPSRQ
jgi:hypothetical protein